MVNIEPADLEISKKGLLKVFYSFHKGDLTMQDAYERALHFCEEKGYKCRYQSFDGFRKNVLNSRH